jgi:two-component system, OmpR family, phosphate regulon sensor histidine kinase PhoR
VSWNPWGGGRRRTAVQAPAKSARTDYALLEEVPEMALVLDARMVVLRANRAARDFFEIAPESIPDSLIILTRELRVEAAIRHGGDLHAEIRLVHRPAILQVTVVPGLAPGEVVAFLTDLTELRRLQVVRQEFVANLSHELRTPITSLRLAAESLAGELTDATRKRFAARALKEADHLAAIVDNLRELAEIEAGKRALRRTRFDLAELVTEVGRRIGVDRVVKVDVEEGVVLYADREKLAQALANLLDNAAKFSPPDKPIEVRAAVIENEYVVSVRDHGPGISPEHWDRIFERFYKVDPARSREMPGSGLGLAITKHLVILMGGRVWTEAAPDGGQVFAFGLPAEP